MDKTKELIKIIQDNPERELIFMYPEEGSEHSFTLGHPSQILIDEYWTDNGRAWLRYEDECEIEEHYGENIACDLYKDFPLTDEQEKNVDQKTKEFVDSQEWEKCICVYIDY